jgi:hypothetical protein
MERGKREEGARERGARGRGAMGEGCNGGVVQWGRVQGGGGGGNNPKLFEMFFLSLLNFRQQPETKFWTRIDRLLSR